MTATQIEFGLYDTHTGECIYKAMGRRAVQSWAIRKGYIEAERGKYFLHIIMGDFDIKPTQGER